MLAFTGSAAPAGLWDKISGSLEERAPAPETVLAPVLSLDSQRQLRDNAEPSTRSKTAMRIWLTAAAAAVALLAVLGAKVVDQGNQIDRLRGESAAGALSSAAANAISDPKAVKAFLKTSNGTASAQAAVEGDLGYLLASNLPVLPADRSYQLWGVIDGKVISLGVLGNHPDVVVFPATEGLTTLVLTDEVKGGVPTSTQPALAAGDLV
jgi:hypothetical protein